MNIYCNQAATVVFIGWSLLLFFKVVMAGLSSDAAKISQDEDDDGDNEHAAKKLKLDHSGHKSKPENYVFPSNLKEFKYYFNKDGQLRNIDTEEPFQFEVRQNDHTYNQRRYEALGEVITEHVYHLLETEAGLKRIQIPIDAVNDEPKSFIFASKEEFDETDEVLVLIHGSGAVRAGQWSRKLITNDCLDSGTQLPFIKRAKKMGFEILVLNSNLNKARGKNGRQSPVRGNGSPRAHVLYVWDNFLKNSGAKSVAIVAHSFGGVCSQNLAIRRTESFMRKVFFLALTDSAHYANSPEASSSVRSWYSQNAINWISSKEPLDTVIKQSSGDCLRVSAGTTEHIETSWKSIDSVFRHLTERLKKRRSRQEEETSSNKDEL